MFERSYFHEGFVRLNFALILKILRLSRARRSKTIECSFTFKRQNQPPEVFCKKKEDIKNFSKFTGKHLCHSLFLKKKTLGQAFSCEFWEISKNTFFTEQLLTNASDTYET